MTRIPTTTGPIDRTGATGVEELGGNIGRLENIQELPRSDPVPIGLETAIKEMLRLMENYRR